MYILKKIFKYSLYLIFIVLLYASASIVISFITVNKQEVINTNKKIYLNTNGVHLSVILPVKSLTKTLKKGLHISEKANYARFGWGNEDFYLNVPTWNDFKFSYALGALFLNTPTIVEVSYYKHKRSKWVEIGVTEEQLKKLNIYLSNSFKIDAHKNKVLINQEQYPNDYLYRANGSYSPIQTCNTWVNEGFKYSGLKASYWTLFDFGLLNKYKNDK